MRPDAKNLRLLNVPSTRTNLVTRQRLIGRLDEGIGGKLTLVCAPASFLNEAMGLDLPAEAIAALEERTEGWIAGLQLAALSMRGREDVSGFVAAFAGTNRHIFDYLAEEVLDRQTQDTREFLLRTSILDWLSGALCDAVTGRDNGQAMLEQLERMNLLLVPLDERRRWYRYHHLFSDFLRERLIKAWRKERPEDVPLDYASRLLQSLSIDSRAPSGVAVRDTATLLLDPITGRERDVLQLLDSDLSNRQIAARLWVSLDTVKSHTRHLYAKLGVHNRHQAVARARDLDLL